MGGEFGREVGDALLVLLVGLDLPRLVGEPAYVGDDGGGHLVGGEEAIS